MLVVWAAAGALLLLLLGTGIRGLCLAREPLPLGHYALVGPRAAFTGEERPGEYRHLGQWAGFELFAWKPHANGGRYVVILMPHGLTGISPGSGVRVRPK